MTLLSSAEDAFLFRFDWFHSEKDNGQINILHILEFSENNQLKLTSFGYWSSYLLAVLANEYVLAVGLESPFRTLAGLARGFGPEMKLEVKLGASNVFAVRASHFFLNKDKTPLTQFRFAQSNDTLSLGYKGHRELA